MNGLGLELGGFGRALGGTARRGTQQQAHALARGYRGDLRIRVGPGIFRVRDQPVDRPPLDLVGRPRPLISVPDSRAGARTRRDGGKREAL